MKIFHCFVVGRAKRLKMELATLLDDIQSSITALQHKVDIIRTMDCGRLHDVDMLMSRKEAAQFIGRSLRQLDRLCDECKIRRERVDGAVRIRRSSLLRFKGLVVERRGHEDVSEIARIINKYK